MSVLRMLNCFLGPEFWSGEVGVARFSFRLRRVVSLVVDVAVLRPWTFSPLRFAFCWGVKLSV